MRSGSTRREFLGAIATGPAVGAVSGRTRGASTASVGQTGEEWPVFGFDAANTGYSPAATGPVENVGGLWTAQTGGRLTAQPAVADGVVYAASKDGRVYAFDAQSGATLQGWPVELEAPTGSPPAVVDGTLYLGDNSGRVYAIDTESGEQEWRFETDGRIERSPAVVDGTVYVSSNGGTVRAIDTDAVRERWSVSISNPTGPAVFEPEASPVPLVYVGSNDAQDKSVYAINSATGNQEWSFESRGPVTSTPAVAEGSVYVCCGIENVPSSGLLYKLDATSGSSQEQPQSTEKRVVGSPAVTDDAVYVGSRSGELIAFDTDLRTDQWSFDTGLQISSSPAVVDGTVYVTSESSFAYAVDTDGKEVWSFQTNGSQFASPAVANGTVYVPSVGSTEASTLYALGADGEIASGVAVGGESPDNVSASALETGGTQSDYAFLVVPAAVGGFATLVAGIGYAVIRSGVTERFEVDEAPVEEIYDGEDEPIPGQSERSQSGVWEFVVGDVIGRADESAKIATENVIVSKHVDKDTLESPVIAYEIESARDDPATIRFSDSFVDDELGREQLSEQPLNDGWTISDTDMAFEATVEPGETIRTMVGRQDCPTERADELLGKPAASIEPLDD